MTIKLGGTISPTFLLGGGVTAYAKQIGEADVVYGATSLLFVLYPSPTGAFYLQAGVSKRNTLLSNHVIDFISGAGEKSRSITTVGDQSGQEEEIRHGQDRQAACPVSG